MSNISSSSSSSSSTTTTTTTTTTITSNNSDNMISELGIWLSGGPTQQAYETKRTHTNKMLCQRTPVCLHLRGS